MNIMQRAWSAIRHPREALRDIKLYRAGQRRVAPYGSRGRTHEARSGGPPGGGHTQAACVKLVPTLRARHFHADTGKWEDLGIIMRGEEQDG